MEQQPMSPKLVPYMAIVASALIGCAQMASLTPEVAATSDITVAATFTPSLSALTAAPTLTSRPPDLVTQLVDPLGGSLRLSGDGRYVAYLKYIENIPQVALLDRQSQHEILISAAPDGTPADGYNIGPSISADGNTVAFFSFASNLEPSDRDDCAESEGRGYCGALYIYDVPSGNMQHIGIGLQYPEGPVTALSADGRYTVFAVHSARLLGDGVYIFDRIAQTLTLINQAGVNPVDISSDGRFVAFAASANDAVAQGSNSAVDIFLYDRESADTVRISIPVAGGESEQLGRVYTSGSRISISADNRYVAFVSTTSNLVRQRLSSCKTYTGETLAACAHVYLYDRQTLSIELISVSSSGDPGNGPSGDADVSADGRFIAFTSFATNLVSIGPIQCQDPGYCPQVYVRDRQEHRTYLVSLGWDRQPPNGYSVADAISDDGRFIAYNSLASNLNLDGPAGGSYITDIFKLLGIRN